MTTTELTQLLTDPSQLNHWSYERLDQLLLQYPYCNGLRMLLLKKYKNDRHIAFNRHLMLASMYAVNRSRLYDFLNTSVVANAETTIVPLAASDTNQEQEVLLVEPPPLYSHKVSENPPILAFQAPITLQELELTASDGKEDREELSAMPVEEWLNRSPEKEKEDLGKKPFKLSRIPVFDTNMFDFLEEEPTPVVEEKEPKKEDEIEKNTPLSEEPTSEKEDVFDFFMQQTDSFLKSLNERKESKEEREWKEIEDDSTTENDSLVSETLAELLALQGQNAKAIKMYAALSLKFPEKSRLFADKIASLEV
ncbi:MAG: hypothetical protein ACRBFS_14345 [Aureispira sp.]